MGNRITLVFLILFCTMMSSCANAGVETEGVKVLATESFLGDIAQNVAGTRLRVETLIPAGADPHEFEPAPADVVAITKSQVLIANGLGYEAWLSKTLENMDSQQLVIIASEGLTPSTDISGENPDGDPHMWMNPLNVIRYVENIRDGLTEADPEGTKVYAQNAQDYITKLKDLDQWVKNEVSQIPQEKRLLVTNHDALGYFANTYGFKIVGAVIPSVTDQASPSAQEMAALIDTIKSSGAPAIFMDIKENSIVAEQIAAETGVRLINDIYVEGISGPDGPAPTYIDMIKHDVLQIVSVLR